MLGEAYNNGILDHSEKRFLCQKSEHVLRLHQQAIRM